MPSGSSSRHHISSSSSSSKKHGGSGSSSRHRSSKNDDWQDVSDAEERRRIQNRNAQRKFREKARETREREERDARNQEYAGSAYHIPSASDLVDFYAADDGLSGVPWGGLNIGHMVAMGHDRASQQGGGGDSADHLQQQQQQQQQQTTTFYDSNNVVGGVRVLGNDYDGAATTHGYCDRYFDTSASSSSPSYLSYDAFAGDGGSNAGTRF